MSHPDSKPGFVRSWFGKLDGDNRSGFRSGRRQIFLVCLLLAGLPLSQLVLYLLNVFPTTNDHFLWVSIASIVLAFSLIGLIWKILLTPLLQLCDWADSMRAVNLDTQVELDENSDFVELFRDINMLGNMINQLSQDTVDQLERHTDYISRESRSLAILYDVASSINIATDLNQMFDKTLISLCSHLGADAGLIRQFYSGRDITISAQQGIFSETFLAGIDRILPMSPDSGSKIQHEHQLTTTGVLENADESQPLSVLSAPLEYRGTPMGMLHLFFQGQADPGNEYDELLHSMGQHLGNSIEKFRLHEEESQLLIMRERSHLSHELHDSLAQTLASLRIQLHLVVDSLQSGNTESGKKELDRICFVVEQANSQLRELIAHFRIPMDRVGLIPSIELAVEQTARDCGTRVHFQNDWPEIKLDDETELNVLRIIQESLVNARKHSNAESIRVMLTHKNGQLTALIEDDGVGFEESEVVPRNGKRLGLSILKDRAEQIQGKISLDSEPGEGTRISLQFSPDP